TDSRTVPVYASDRSADAGLDIEAYGQHAADEGPLDQISRPCGPNNRWNSHRSSVFRLFVPQEAIRNVEYLPIAEERPGAQRRWRHRNVMISLRRPAFPR